MNSLTDNCPKCGAPLRERQAYPYPVKSQILFALSFVFFLFAQDKIASNKIVLGAWCLFQIALGAWLIRGRLRARKRIYHCVRCQPDLR